MRGAGGIAVTKFPRNRLGGGHGAGRKGSSIAASIRKSFAAASGPATRASPTA